ncbi:uncharacterized protein V2V93DRAFT_382009 [Kockiozyma suomiensis]|uniref:uncharacterized protein n=1 Tax=Kockiozyma suomiensis TaxID=1337062 RepID=UPI0033442B91
MFRKKPNIKPLSPVRSSDRRKLLAAIATAYNLDLTTLPPEAKESLLPSDILTAKYVAPTPGVSGQIYVSAVDGRPVWLKLPGEKLVPTVFTIWKCAFLVPIVRTWSPVIEKLRGGADMMLPGLIPPFPAGAKKGAVVAIASEERSSVPLAVGICDLDLEGVNRVVGKHGKAILVVHCYGDELPVKGKITVPLELSLEVPRAEIAETAAPEEVEEKALEEAAKTEGDDVEKIAESVAEISIETEPKESIERAVKEDGPTTDEVDEAFHQALLSTIFEFRTGSLQLTFPQPSSTFISANLLRHLPVYFSSAQMKQTSWKKAAKFLRAMEKEGLLKIKEKGGDVTITSVAGADHAQLKQFKPFKILASGSTSKKSISDDTSQSSTKASANPTKLTVKEYYQIRDKAKPVADAVGKRTGSGIFYTGADLRAIVMDYIAREDLVDEQNPREIKLDPLLASIFPSSAAKPRRLPRETLIEAFRGACAQYYQVLRDDEDERTAGKMSKGSPPKIQLLITMKQGHKVTRIMNLETYKFDVSELANELRTECASSTTVNRSLEGTGGGGQGKLEVLVQGPQGKAAVEVLERHGVKKTWVEVKDSTKKK